MKLVIERMAAKGLDIAENDDLHAGTGDGDVHAAQVTEEAYLSFVVRTDEGDDDDVALLPLEAVDGVHADERAEGLEELALLQQLAQQLYLCTVWRDDAHVEPLIKDALLANHLEVGLQGKDGEAGLRDI